MIQNDYLTIKEDFIKDLDRRLWEDEIKLINIEVEQNIIIVEFEINSFEEEYLEQIRSRVETISFRVINKHFDIYGQVVEDTYCFEKGKENKIIIKLF